MRIKERKLAGIILKTGHELKNKSNLLQLGSSGGEKMEIDGRGEKMGEKEKLKSHPTFF